jgi:inosine/xanthosine triphosphate pyrophosphatase family protein
MMTQTTLTFEEIDALLKFIDFHTESFSDEESEQELNEIVGTDVSVLYDKLSEMMDEV